MLYEVITLVEVSPAVEEGHHRLMEALAAAGRPKDALRQYAMCVRALREVLDRAPSASAQGS